MSNDIHRVLVDVAAVLEQARTMRPRKQGHRFLFGRRKADQHAALVSLRELLDALDRENVKRKAKSS